MRILVVATDVQIPGSHGGSTHVSELFSGLKKRADTLLLASVGSSGEGVEPIGHPLRKKHWRRQLDAARLLPTALPLAQRFQPDVIYERCSSYGLGALLSTATGAPLLTMVLDERFSWLSLLRADTLVATRYDMIPLPFRNKWVRVSWGANAEHFNADIDASDLRAELGFGPRGSEFVVAYGGSFKRWHGLPLLVDAAAQLPDPAVRFLLVGDGSERPAIEAQVRRAGLQNRFVFTGSVSYDDMPRYLSVADACAAPFDPDQHGPSRERGSFVLDPLKVFEYLALGLPTITIASANMTSIFRDRKHVAFYEAGDLAQLVAALRWVSAEREQARAMATQGHELVLAKYTWQAHADHLVELFRDMLVRRAA